MPTAPAPLEKRAVVSCFIIKEATGTGGKARVALFRRSSRMPLHQHHWAPITGRLDGADVSPLARAWRQLQEGTGLTATSLALIRHGKPFSFDDVAAGCAWTIYPFAFRMLTGPGGSCPTIQLSAQHEGWAWVDPLTVQENSAFGEPLLVDKAPLVPHLATGLRRAWFEADLGSSPGTAGAALARGLERLHQDHRSGARQLAGVALGVLRDVVLALDRDKHLDLALPLDRHIWWAQVRFAAWHVWRNGRESMGAAVLSLLLSALAGIEDKLQNIEQMLALQSPAAAAAATAAGGSRYATAEHIVPDLETRMAEQARPASTEPVAAALVPFLEARFGMNGDGEAAENTTSLTILTVSESSTVLHALQQLRARGRFSSLAVRVLESRPLFEGVSFGVTLASEIVNKTATTTTTTTSGAGDGGSSGSGGGDGGSSGSGGGDGGVPTTVTLYSDASAALAAMGVDVVLLGADRVSSDGAVSNKTGTLPAVLCAKNQGYLTGGNGAPPATEHGPALTVVLTETDKIAPGDPREHLVEENDAAQLTRAWSGVGAGMHVRAVAGAVAGMAPTLAVRNVCFEWVPAALVDAYVTEKGVWTVEQIGQHAEVLETEAERLFKDV